MNPNARGWFIVQIPYAKKCKVLLVFSFMSHGLTLLIARGDIQHVKQYAACSKKLAKPIKQAIILCVLCLIGQTKHKNNSN